MLNDLTTRQNETLDIIVDAIEEDGFPPTVRELQDKLEVASVRGATVHLDALEKKGYIERNGKARGIRVLRRPWEDVGNGSIEIPLVGQVAAGRPILAEENIEKYVSVKREYLRGARDAFLLKVEGDSMVEADINPGDLAIVIPTNTAQNGDVVIALMEDVADTSEVATLKKFHQVEDYVALLPANQKYEPIIGKQFSVQGKVIGVIREDTRAREKGSLLKDAALVPVYNASVRDAESFTQTWSFGATAA